jgi:hypothetical protein
LSGCITFDACAAAANVDAIGAVEAAGVEEFESVNEEGAEAVSVEVMMSGRVKGCVAGMDEVGARHEVDNAGGKWRWGGEGGRDLNEKRLALIVRGNMVTSSCSTLTHSTCTHETN